MSELGDRIQLIFDVARPYEDKIIKLENEKAELIKIASEFVEEINRALHKIQSPTMDGSHNPDIKYLLKRYMMVYKELNKLKEK